MNMDAAIDGRKYPPIYEHPLWWARRFGELEQFQASHTQSVACAAAINLILAKNYDFDANHPDITAAAKEVVDKFGFDRTMYVLANTVWEYAGDDNIFPSSREWARTIPCYDEPDISRGYAVSGNTDVIDRLISQVRHDYSLFQTPQAQEQYEPSSFNEGADMNEDALPVDSFQQLCKRMEASYQIHCTGWMELSPSALIEQAKEIAAIQDTREYMAQGRGIDPEGVNYLLTLTDPLQTVADFWLQRMDDLSDFGFALDELCRRQNVSVRRSVLAQLQEKGTAGPSKPHTPTKEQEER